MTEDIVILQTVEEVTIEVVANDEVVIVERPVVDVVMTGTTGPRGAQGPPGSSTVPESSYVHEQASADSVWTITHGLGFYPSVTVVTSAGDKVYGDVNFVDADTVTCFFSSAFGGFAYLS